MCEMNPSNNFSTYFVLKHNLKSTRFPHDLIEAIQHNRNTTISWSIPSNVRFIII